MPEDKKIKKPLGVARLVEGKCISCGARCMSVCPKHAIGITDQGIPLVDITRCTGCRRCIKVCPAQALEIYYTPEQLKLLEELAARGQKIDLQDTDEEEIVAGNGQYRGVWVFVEQTDSIPAAVSWELLSVGQTLARQLKVELCAVIIGEKVEGICKEAFAYGAGKVYLMEAAVYRYYRTEPYFKALCYLVNRYHPEIVLIGASGMGRDLAGAVATELRTGLTADCTGLTVDDERRLLMQTRPAFGGNIMATIVTEKSWPQMATVRPHTMHMHDKDESLSGEIVREWLDIQEDEVATKVIEIIDRRTGNEVDITAADIIVSGGRGVQAAENFRLLQDLADELGGVVACSRSVVDAGWMPSERQVGQTGKTVRPKIYIACGISGAIQHIVGMQNSDIIIAINRDRNAPIFEVAHYGLVGDLSKIVPSLTRQIKALRANSKS